MKPARRIARNPSFERNSLCGVGILSCLGVLFLAGVLELNAATTYTIQHIAGMRFNFGVSLSDSGLVAADRYLWNNGTLVDLGGLGGTITYAEGVNSAGQVVGRSSDVSHGMHAFRWQNGIMSVLPNLGGDSGYAVSINDRGEAVGYTDNSPAASVINSRATFWTTSGAAVDIGTIGADGASRAHALNNLGQAAGVSFPANGSGFGGDAFFWDGVSRIPFIQNVDPARVSIRDLNDAGRVVGGFNSDSFLWHAGVLTSLGTLGGTDSMAEGINNAGQIVGSSADLNGVIKAYLYEDGQMRDLRTLVPVATGWSRLTQAFDINNSGQIVGVGTFNGSNNEVFLLTPVPEPDALLLTFGAGIAAWHRRGRFRGAALARRLTGTFPAG